MGLLGGCSLSQIPSLKSYLKSGIGSPISVTREIASRPGSHASRIGWNETTYPLANGHWVYIEPDRKDCFIHWEVNPEGIIVGYKTEGKGCEYNTPGWVHKP
jgi:hypothetical protein